jgi:hypothetical protein
MATHDSASEESSSEKSSSADRSDAVASSILDRRVRLVTPGELKQAYNEDLEPAQKSGLISWLAFTLTFVVARVITHSIKGGSKEIHNVSVGGLHLHHYLWGILTVSAVGGTAIHCDDRVRRHPATAAAYGAGLALIVDEFALLLDLKDVYWAKQGRDSVDLAIGLISTTGSVLVGLPIIHRLRRNRSK